MGTAALDSPTRQQQPQGALRPRSLEIPENALTKIAIPEEFRCPISGDAMADPVIVASGQSYERSCIQAWLGEGRKDCFRTKAKLEHTFLIPNVALKAAILNWSTDSGISAPQAVSPARARDLVEATIKEERSASAAAAVAATTPDSCDRDLSAVRYVHSATGVNLRTDIGEVSSSGASSSRSSGAVLPPSLETNPRSVQEQQEKLCATMDPRSVPDLVRKLRSPKSESDQTAGTSQVRKLAREGAFNRRTLCQEDLLGALVGLLQSPFRPVVVNSAAALLNLSLEAENKQTIVRAGALPLLVQALRSSDAELQELAAGAIFSLALHEDNRLAIGVLGAIPPLIDILRSRRSPLAQQDASMALFHLSLTQLNRSKMVKAGLVPILLSIAENHRQRVSTSEIDAEKNNNTCDGDLASRCMSILSCLAASSDGRKVLLEINGVKRLFALLGSSRRDQHDDEDRELKEHVVAALVQLSHHNIRFKSLAAEAGGAEALAALLDSGAATSRAKEKIVTLLSIFKEPPPSSAWGVNSPSFTTSTELYFARSRRNGGKAESSYF